jgi:hypothetical protein
LKVKTGKTKARENMNMDGGSQMSTTVRKRRNLHNCSVYADKGADCERRDVKQKLQKAAITSTFRVCFV